MQGQGMRGHVKTCTLEITCRVGLCMRCVGGTGVLSRSRKGWKGYTRLDRRAVLTLCFS